MPEAAVLLSLAESIADGQSIDWDAVEARLSADDKPLIRQLRLLADVASLHRSLPADPSDLRESDRRTATTRAIGRWAHLELLERVGAGTFGEVYRAWDPQLEREVALKLLRAEEPSRDLDASRVAREGRLLARVRHPNVVTVFGVAVHEGRVGMWMELLRGVTLEELISRQGALGSREAALVGIDVCRAVAAIHAAGLIHRDIKAQNVMREEGGRIVLMDFGTGRNIEAAGTAAVSDWAGTPLYLAPEIFLGLAASERSDLYSVGVLLYRLVTGSFPVHAGTIDELKTQHATEAPRRLRDARPDLPTAFVTVVDRAIATDPDRRYASAGALEAGLVQALEEHAPAVSVPPVVAGRGASRRASVAAAMAAMAAVIAFGVWTWVSRPPASSPPSSVRGGAVRLAILPPQNLTGDASIDQWPQLIQSLFADELAGVHGIAVIDPLGLNGLVEGRLDPASARQSPQLLNLLRRADVSLIVDGRILKAGVGYDLRINLVDPLSGETRFPAHATIAREDTLAATVTTLAANVLGFLQVQPLASDKDLRPAFSFGRHDIRAVNAFLEAAQYVYRDEHAKATAPLRRALQIDPTFVAPRIWLIPGLVATNNLAEARQHYQYLVNLRDLNPLERALTAYAGALIAHDRGGVAANLELALEYVPGNNILLFNLADIRALTGNCAGALDALKPEVAIRWRYPPVYALWGVCAIEMDRMPEARTVLTDAITLPHVYPSVYGFLEAIAIADGDAASAKRHRDRLDARLRELDQRDKSDMAVAYDHLGSSAYEAGHSDRAAILFRRALTLEPTSPHPQLMLRTINEDQRKEG